MDELQERLVRDGLAVLAPYGFVLAGGYALQAHGLVERMSEDVDLFTDQWDAARFSEAVNALRRAYEAVGLDVSATRQADTFARLQVTDDASGQVGSVDLAADVRAGRPAMLSIGPVLSEEDAVGGKVATLFSRGEARDYLDVYGILTSGRYETSDLERLAARSDPGFRASLFAEALRAIARFPDGDFARYGAGPAHVQEVRRSMEQWSTAIERRLGAETRHPGRMLGRPQTPEPPAPPDPGLGPSL